MNWVTDYEVSDTSISYLFIGQNNLFSINLRKRYSNIGLSAYSQVCIPYVFSEIERFHDVQGPAEKNSCQGDYHLCILGEKWYYGERLTGRNLLDISEYTEFCKIFLCYFLCL